MVTVGNNELMKHTKTAFLCSRKVPAGAILKCYDWAIEQRNQDKCIISGFHSKIERDVLHFLIKGSQPIILVLARSMYKRWDKAIKERLDKGNLLIITLCKDSQKRAGAHSCQARNKFILDMADIVVLGYLNPSGELSKLISKIDIPVEVLYTS